MNGWSMPRPGFVIALGGAVVLFAFFGPPPASKIVAFASLLSAVAGLVLAILNAGQRAPGRS